MNPLPTVIIPFYKLRYLEAALDSLAAQGMGRFKVFIGDDASPENPLALMEKYRDSLDIEYHRFESNLGGTSLTRHWDRCVKKTNGEWLWLFSDDDVASSGCMRGFVRTLEETKGSFDVYRFNTQMIDGEGKLTHRHPVHPKVEGAPEFALAKILGERFSFAVEYIFRRSSYEACGGFKEFPLAWCSDDASWISFGRRTGIRTIEGAEVLWRKSGLNISSPNPLHVSRKLEAFQSYLLWLRSEFPDASFQQRLKAGIAEKFPNQIQHWGGNPGWVEGMRFWFFFSRFTGRLNPLLLRTLLGASGLRRKWRLF